ncbi:hypothetical protein KAI46_13715 [bacterium]|nr:hypothetical protein [bacterium]
MQADIFAPGAQELIYGRKMMISLKEHAGNTSIVCGNLGGEPIPGIKTHKIITIDNKKILITTIIDPKLEKKAIHGLKVAEPLASLNKILQIPHDLAIAVLHFSDKRARAFLHDINGLNIAILGTQRGIITESETINNCLLVKNNNHGKTIGYLDWDFTTATATTNKLLKINKETYAADKIVYDLVDKHEAWLRNHYVEMEKKKAENSKSTMPPSPYAGNSKCATCHPQITTSWKKTKHATAYATLQKKCKEYCPDCLPCHSTGSYDHGKTGFRSPSMTPHLFNVQCEECHGPAQKHIKNPDLPYGNPVDGSTCIICHTTNTDPEFSFPDDVKLIAH